MTCFPTADYHCEFNTHAQIQMIILDQKNRSKFKISDVQT